MKKISIVITASGHAKRFGSNKLLADLNGKPVIQYTFEAIPERIEKTIVVAWDREILDLAESFGFTGVYNDDKTDDPSITVTIDDPEDIKELLKFIKPSSLITGICAPGFHVTATESFTRPRPIKDRIKFNNLFSSEINSCGSFTEKS